MRVLLTLVSFLLLLCKNECASGEVYRYEDDGGIIHFNDRPTDRRFKVYMGDLKRDKNLTIKDWFAIRRDNGNCTPCEAPANSLISSKAHVVAEVIKDGKPVIVTVGQRNTNDAITYYKTIELCQKESKRIKRTLEKYR